MTQRGEDEPSATPGLGSSDAGSAESRSSSTSAPLFVVGLALVTLLFAWTSLQPSGTDPRLDPARTPDVSGRNQAVQDAETYGHGVGLQLNQLQTTERGWTAVYGPPRGSSDGSVCVDFGKSSDGDVHGGGSYRCH